MTISIESQGYHDDNLVIEERVIEIEDDESDVWFESRLPETDALVLIQFLHGEPEITPDIPLPEFGERKPTGQIFAGAMDAGARAFIRLTARGIVKVRIIFAQVRKHLIAAKNAFPCRFCKLAVHAILSTVLTAIGVPVAAGTFDATGFVANLQNAGAQIATGGFSTALSTIASLLPPQYWTAVMAALNALGWIFDVTDRLLTSICRTIGMCPPAPPQTAGSP